MRTIFIGYNSLQDSYYYLLSDFPFCANTVQVQNTDNSDFTTYRLIEFKYNIPELDIKEHSGELLLGEYVAFKTKDDGYYLLLYVEECLINKLGELPSKVVSHLEAYLYDALLDSELTFIA